MQDTKGWWIEEKLLEGWMPSFPQAVLTANNNTTKEGFAIPVTDFHCSALLLLAPFFVVSEFLLLLLPRAIRPGAGIPLQLSSRPSSNLSNYFFSSLQRVLGLILPFTSSPTME